MAQQALKAHLQDHQSLREHGISLNVGDPIHCRQAFGCSKCNATDLGCYVRTQDATLKTLPEAMNEREKWRERVRDIRASGTDMMMMMMMIS